MSLLVPARSAEPEWLETRDCTAGEVEENLREIAWVNRRLGGARALLRGIVPFFLASPGDGVVEILDVGTGGGDLAAAMVEQGRRLGRRVIVTALDRHPAAAAFAAREAPSGVRVVRGDGTALPFPDRSFDLVTASLFLHHFGRAEAVALITAFRRVARQAVVINDLRRHRFPWVFITVAGRVAGRTPTFNHDAALSVRRGFTAAELRALARDAGAPGASVQPCWPYRLLLTLPAAGLDTDPTAAEVPSRLLPVEPDRDDRLPG